MDTSASLKLSKQVDPTGSNTLLCLTKVDLYQDIGFDKKIQNYMEKLNINKHNLFLIRNKKQIEIENQISFEEARRLEEEFLSSNSELRHFPQEMKGLNSFSERLIHLQRQQFERSFGTIYRDILRLKQEKEEELTKFGKTFNSPGEIYSEIYMILNKIKKEMEDHHKGMNLQNTIQVHRTFFINSDMAPSLQRQTIRHSQNEIVFQFKENKN